MQIALAVTMLIAGVALGGVAVWLAMRGREAAAADRERSLGESERAVLQTKLAESERRNADLNSESAAAREHAVEMQSRLSSELERRSAAEESAKQIAPLAERLRERESRIEQQHREITELSKQAAEISTALEDERRSGEEKLAVLREAEQKLSDAFKALSHEALRNNNQSFIDLAKATLEKFHEGAKGDLEKRQQAIDEIVKPVSESLKEVDKRIQEIEKERSGAYEGIKTQIEAMTRAGRELRDETAKLGRALRTPAVRGRWGEIQLRRVVELAGMLNHCDFFEQQSSATESGGRLRPDMIVRLPSERTIIVDSKVPLESFLKAIDAESDEARAACLRDHARAVRDHVKALSLKSYAEQFDSHAEFVVLFLPGESFFSAALEHDPSLIEWGAGERVILATPTTLIALLKAVAYGWRQEALAEEAHKIAELGRKIYDRLSVLAGHMRNVGKNLGDAVKAHNEAVGSFESRLLVTAREFKRLEAAGTVKEIEALNPIETMPRLVESAELFSAEDEPASERIS